MTLKICVVDTTFARIDMFKYFMETIKKEYPSAEIIRQTVPGIKDIPGALKRLISKHKCNGAISLGWVGKELVDKFSYIAYSVGIIMLGILTEIPIIDVTIHEDEAESPEKLINIAIDRVKKHTRNLILLLTRPKELSKFAGSGLRQGYPNVGALE